MSTVSTCVRSIRDTAGREYSTRDSAILYYIYDRDQRVHSTAVLCEPPGSDAYASDKGVFVKPTRAGVSSGWHSPSRRVWKGLKQ